MAELLDTEYFWFLCTRFKREAVRRKRAGVGVVQSRSAGAGLAGRVPDLEDVPACEDLAYFGTDAR